MVRNTSSQAANLALKTQLKQAYGLHESGQLNQAIALYEQIIKIAPGYAEAHELLGVAQSQSGLHNAGLKNIRKALQLNPRLGPAKTNFGHALMNAGRLPEAIEQFKLTTANNPVDERAFIGLSQALIAANRIDEAITVLDQATARFPSSATFLNERGRAASVLGKHKIAAEDYRRAMQIKPNFLGAAINFGNALIEQHLYVEAEDVLLRVLKTDRNSIQAARALANAYRRQQKTEAALEMARSALAIAPQDPGLNTVIGQCLTDLGQNHEAEIHFRKVIALGIEPMDAIASLAPIYKFKDGDPEFAAVDRLLATSSKRPDKRKSLLFAKSKMLDDVGRHGDAVAAAIEAKSMLPPPNSFDAHAAFMRDMMKGLGAAYFAERRSLGDPTEQPVFILGMPRSGTTLTEQIIASHASADGAGELTKLLQLRQTLGFGSKVAGQVITELMAASQEEIRSHASQYLAVLRFNRKPDALRITDKLPHNFQNIWLIALLFPNARIIHCKRNAVDVCMSIFLRNFSDDHWYTRNLETLGKFYKLYEEQVAHWKAVTGLRWYDNDYEQLVADPEPNIRNMIDFLGLPWDEKCLSHTETERPVLTFSKWQVRQPIYTSSVEKWRRYAPYIGPLLKELGVPAT